jgi:hypothetical protein
VGTTLVRKVLLQISADDGDTETKLDNIQRKADELARDHPELTPRINTAAASAKLAVLRKELKDTQNQSNDSRTSIKDLAQALNSQLHDGLTGGIEDMSGMQKVMAAFDLATGLAEPLLAGVTVGVMGLASGLVSAGAGAGIFGAVAYEAISSLSGPISNATADLNKMGTATTLKQQNADAKAFESTLKGLSGPQKQLVTGIANAESGWDFFVKTAANGVDSTLAPALREVPLALHDASEFLGPVESGLSKVISLFNKGFASSGTQGFIKELAADSGPDLEKLSVMLGHIVTGIDGILQAFLPMSGSVLSGLDKITAKFSTWGTTLTSHSGFKDLMSMFKQDTPILLKLLSNLGSIIRIVASEMTGMDTAANSRTLLQLATTISGLVNSLLQAHPQLVWLILYLKMGASGFGKLRDSVKAANSAIGDLQTAKKALGQFTTGFGDATKAADDATGAWGTWGGKMSSVLGGVKSLAISAAQKLGLIKVAEEGVTEATEGETAAQEGLDVAMDANPIGIIILAVAALAVGIYELAKHSEAFRAFWKAAWKDISKSAVDAWHELDNDVLHPIEDGISTTVSFIKSHWQAVLVGILTGPIGVAALYIIDHWKSIETGAENTVSRVVSFFESLPGRIVRALGNLGSDLFRAGVSAISGLLSGAGSMIGRGESMMAGWGHDLLNALGSPFGMHFSEPSEALQVIKAGRNIPLGLAAGMDAGLGTATAAAARVARAAQIGSAHSPALAGGYGSGRGATIQIEWVGGQGDQQFLTWIKKNIRIRGGNVDNMGR